MTKRMVIMIVGLVILFGAVFAIHQFVNLKIGQFVSKVTHQPAVVATTKAVTQTWNPNLTAVGTLTAVNGVNVSAEVNGQVTQIHFTSGERVNKGDSLVQLDDSLDQQSLITNQAQLNLDKTNYQRQLELYKTKSTSKTDLDNAQAKMVISEAASASAQVQIDKKNIKAPFAGKLGIREVNIGEYVNPGQALVTLQALDPLYVDFYLPEQDLKSLHVGQTIKVTVDAFPKQVFTGQIVATSSEVDVNTRSIEVRAKIPNEQVALYPGMFANVKVLLPAQDNVVTLPQTAIAYSLHGDTAYVIEEDGKDKQGKPKLVAKQRFITVGAREGNKVAVLKGIKAGEQVVIAGQSKLQPGAVVTINNKVALN